MLLRSEKGTQGDTPRPPLVALTIAGHDPSSGAGITADLQVFAAFGLYGTTCITGLTVQSTRGVRGVEPVAGLIGRVLAELELDLPCAGVKIGMLGDTAAVGAVAAFLDRLRPEVPVVLDPVILSSSGAELLTPDALAMLQRELLPRVGWVTPNGAELARLTGEEGLAGLEALQAECPQLHIVATDGEAAVPTDVLRLPSGATVRFAGERVETTSTHGTGCAFSAALLSRLVAGDDAVAAVGAAKAYVAEAMRRAPGLGGGRGPLDLLWPLRRSSAGG